MYRVLDGVVLDCVNWLIIIIVNVNITSKYRLEYNIYVNKQLNTHSKFALVFNGIPMK